MTGEPILKPLKEQQHISDPDLALGARLLVHAQPLPRSEIRKRRVWNMLASSPGSRLGFRLTAVHVAAASVLFAAVSSAAAGHYYVEHRAAQVSEAAPAEATPAAKARRSHAPAKQKPAPTKAAEPTEPTISPEEIAALPQSAAPSHAAPTRPKADASLSRKSDADAELLVEAMRARGAGDSARVSELVDQYRAKHPQGVLQEEALILSIESAAARRAPNTAALAREYLQRFPKGRFAAQARRAAATDTR